MKSMVYWFVINGRMEYAASQRDTFHGSGRAD